MARDNRKGRRGQAPLSIGEISVSRKGYGFVDSPEGQYFISHNHLRGAMDGDLVEVVRLRSLEAKRRQQAERFSDEGSGTTNREGRRDMLGAVRRVIQRAHERIVGTLHSLDGLGVVCPHDVRITYDIFLDLRAPNHKKAVDGDLVVVRITEYPGPYNAAQGYIEEVIGREDEKDVGIEVIIREHGFETVFSAGALEEAEALAKEGALEKEVAFEKEGAFAKGDILAKEGAFFAAVLEDRTDGTLRRDLRGRYIFTIDPYDARDFDDALSVDFIDGQMRLGVHIADVSAYVKWDSAIDLDARRRATSVYLPDRVIPMLPPELCEDLCSLRPSEDRAAFTVDMLMGSDGSLISSEFYPSLIRSSARLSYDEVDEQFESHDKGTPNSMDALLLNKLLAARKLSRKLARRRLQRGAIEFESIEPKLRLDEEGVPISVRLRTKTDATAVVEEAMILANEQVAAYMLKHMAPMVYRIHARPLAGTLDELLPVLQEFGYAQQGAPKTSHEIQAILQACAKRPEFHLVSTLLLRSMKRARYASVFTEHFGLASKAYTHFTSPIRRYPDLMVHRLLKCHLADGVLPDTMQRQLDWICEHSTDKEREADLASLEATAIKLCEFLEPRIGQVFSGIVTSLNSSGITIQEDTTTAEGYIDREDLPDGLVFDTSGFRYHDPDTGESFRLGQELDIMLKGVDQSRAKLQFVIA